MALSRTHGPGTAPGRTTAPGVLARAELQQVQALN